MKKLIITKNLIGFENEVFDFFETLEDVIKRITELNSSSYIEREYRINRIFEEHTRKPIGFIQNNFTFYAIYESEKNNIVFITQRQIDFLMKEFNLKYSQVLQIINYTNDMK